MALVQTEKTPGTITVEATCAGLSGAQATVSSKQVELRPHVSIWQRPIPKGAGITGLWTAVSDSATGFVASVLGTPRIFTLTEEGGKLTGTVEGPGGWFGGEDAPATIRDGVVDGDHVSFKSGINVFDGKIKGADLELERTVHIPFSMPTPPKKDPNAPVIGPAPDGTNPSFDMSDFSGAGKMTVTLRRSER
jgi:beta-galactosidase